MLKKYNYLYDNKLNYILFCDLGVLPLKISFLIKLILAIIDKIKFFRILKNILVLSLILCIIIPLLNLIKN